MTSKSAVRDFVIEIDIDRSFIFLWDRNDHEYPRDRQFLFIWDDNATYRNN